MISKRLFQSVQCPKLSVEVQLNPQFSIESSAYMCMRKTSDAAHSKCQDKIPHLMQQGVAKVPLRTRSGGWESELAGIA